MTPADDRFLDTNILLRHLLNDVPAQSAACRRLIEAIEAGRTNVWTTDLMIAEAVFVLSNKRTYNLGRDAIRDVLLPIIGLPGLRLPGKRLYPRIFELYVSRSIDFIDAYHAALLEQQALSDLYSYDTDFDRIPSVRRIEP